MTIRVASYNVRKCLGLDRRRSPGRVVDVLNALDADVIAVQEADRRLGARPAALPHRLVESASDFNVAPVAENEVSLGWHGNALLLRNGLKVTAQDRIPLPGLEPRGAVLVEVSGPQGQLRVVGVHLGLVRRYRVQQLLAIRAALVDRAAMPTVILGDFNEWSPDKGMAPLLDAFDVHAPGHSYHAARPVAGLDRIALCPEITLNDAGVVETDTTRVASDHLPVWADIDLPPTTRPA